MSTTWTTLLLLTASNVFMTFAWYGHLRFKQQPLWLVVVASWAIAFFEYCLMVPANRFGSNAMSGYQLKILQEVITLAVFIGFAWLYLGEQLRWNHAVSMALILAAAGFAFLET
jgi:uncharacterized protein